MTIRVQLKTIHRYTWNEFLQQFLVCWIGFTILGIGKIFFDYNDLFIGYRVTLKVLLTLLLNQIPYLWMDIFPAATLFGVILAFGRLLRERELDVIQLSGYGIFHTMLPVFVGLLILCIGAFYWNDLVVPAANHRFEIEVRRLSNQQGLPLLRENVVFKAPNNRFVYFNRIEHNSGKIKGILIIETKGPGKWPRLISANWGRIQRGIWELNEGVLHEFDAQGAVASELTFQKMQLKMVADYSAVIGDEKGPAEMRAEELKRLATLYGKSGLNLPVYSVFFYSKFADPLSPLVFAFLAIPLTILTGRNARLWTGMVYCFLLILGYYALQVVGRTLGVNGLVLPWLAAWVPNITFFITGIILLILCEQRR
ncbi:LPS export ABC transporter permease LptG [Hydrogenispora ethanolica]|uniref:LPS export ABC transporter permease LptG n=1 Tax=Hydrogenispora ethanolica TaxID=1082276 RepID=A0A4R1R943_HYDET|nr:LptF/LptG family permease [Hydrogenispora ethanolica]TCL62213.1 LPS export ABC transporter permease LptG [Hydrogenispora ethanolica]